MTSSKPVRKCIWAFPTAGRAFSPASRAIWRPAKGSFSCAHPAPRPRPRWRKTGRAGVSRRRQPDRLAVKAGGIEIARVADLLIIQDGARAIFRRRRLDGVFGDAWRAATRQGLTDHPPA